LSLVGLAATVAVAALMQCLLEGQPPRFADWFAQPGTQVEALAAQLADRSFLGLLVRVGTALAVVAGLWAVTGGWIARHEVLARHRSQPDSSGDPLEPGPTRLVTGKLKDLVLGLVMVLALCAVLILPVLLAGTLNRLGGIGVLLVAVLLPVVLVADLVLLCLLVGLVAWPLMPVTIAVENSDVFDALSRAYNYAYTRPVRFTLLTVATLTAAGAPVVIILRVLAGPVENWLAAAGHPAVWAAAGLSVSVYWSLQTLAYLNLRTAVDSVDANLIAHEAEPKPAVTPEPASQSTADSAPKPPARSRVGTHISVFVLMVAAWVLTAWLFTRFGGEKSDWLGWGVGEHFRPRAEGVYWYASLLAGAWGAIWIAAPVLVAVRQMLRPDSRDAAAKPPADGEGQPNRS
jgi:hypothetical protein